MLSNNIFYLRRILQISLAFIPACMGILAFINNITDWNGTMDRVVLPLLSMLDNKAYSTQGWRAVNGQLFPGIIYGFVTTLELLMGLAAAYGAVGMIRYRDGPFTEFRKCRDIVGLACMFGAFIYCFIFFTVGGDWFLAWKNDNLLFLQGDSLNYALVLTIVFLYLHFSVEEAR
ncbi:MAG: DUF2165 family protein [Gammaproteobacteria bacterium]|nr:DUF2165 family protein [Gammaproteobacteria bacterium]MDE0511428.1 DUF2165 family protein [Gammaproteobacteria bacterium]